MSVLHQLSPVHPSGLEREDLGRPWPDTNILMDKEHLGNKKLTRWKDSTHTFNQFILIIFELLRAAWVSLTDDVFRKQCIRRHI